MKLISMKQAEQHLARHIKKRSAGETTLYTFKQDRRVTVFCRADGLHIEEAGYRTQQLLISDPSLWKRAVKEALKREFPRSRNVYIKETSQ